MNIEKLTQRSLALRLDEDERELLLDCEGHFSLPEAKRLADTAFTGFGMTRTGRLELDLFDGSDGLLIFARDRDRRETLCAFESLERLFEAILALPSPKEDAALVHLEGTYYLFFPSAPPEGIAEYGSAVPLSARLRRRLEEDGSLISRRAFALFKEWAQAR